MVTKKQIDFLRYSQKYNSIKPGIAGKAVIKAMRMFKRSDAAYKVDFFERMLNYIRVIALDALAANTTIDIICSKRSAEEIAADKDTGSFVEFLLQFDIIEHKNKVLIVNPKYSQLLRKGLAEDIVATKGILQGVKYTKQEKLLVKDFLFVTDLINKSDDPAYSFEFITSDRDEWEALVSLKKLEYEVRLCKTFYNLVNLRIPHKIESPFDEDFYTESGRNAFKNFTRYIFKKYLRQVSKGKSKLNVFDLGCGYGDYIGAVHEAFSDYKVTGVEINPAVYSETVNKFREIKNVDIINEDFFNYNPDKKYDVLLMNYVLFYFNREEKERVFEKAKSILNKNGSIILCQYMSGIEDMKKELAKQQNDYSLTKKIEMYYSDKVLYANTLWNDAVDTFSEAVKWDELKSMLSEHGLYIESMTNADKFYYSLFIEIKKN